MQTPCELWQNPLRTLDPNRVAVEIQNDFYIPARTQLLASGTTL